MKIKNFNIMLLILLVIGCASTTVQVNHSFNANQAKLLLETGSNNIEGSALLRQKNGGVITCAGRKVLLVPETKYAQDRILGIYGNDVMGFTSNEAKFLGTSPEEESQYLLLTKETICDTQGFFKFKGIKDGSFYVITQITWDTSRYSSHGGYLMKKIEIQNGETKEIVLTY